MNKNPLTRTQSSQQGVKVAQDIDPEQYKCLLELQELAQHHSEGAYK
jgi:hypothetical protein